jgi:hypothetical protein
MVAVIRRARTAALTMALGSLSGVFPGVAMGQSPMPSLPATPMSRTIQRLDQSSMRPLPTVPPSAVPRSADVWVPDRFVRLPGVVGDLHVPGHWERTLPDGEVFLPPLAGVTTRGQSIQIPAGRYPPVGGRLAP